MELITNGQKLARHLARCIDEYDDIWFAVAWVSTGTKAYDALLRRRDAIQRGVVGIHFYQTMPQVLADFAEDKQVRFALQPSGVFHPKIFVFQSGRDFELFVGSANLTASALTRNTEIVLHLTNQDEGASQIRDELKGATKEYWKDAKAISLKILADYQAAHERMKSARQRLSGSYGSNKSTISPLESPVMCMTWREFLDKVQDEGQDKLKIRLELLAAAGQAFEAHPDFGSMDKDTRAMIAGLPNSRSEDAGFFGSMKGDGRYHGAVKRNAPQLSLAFDHILSTGPVTRAQYITFVGNFASTFTDSHQRPGLASRLLTLKRPDIFVCLSKRNRKALAKDFGIAASGIDYDTYWDGVIERIQDSNWWSSSKPTNDQERKIWNGRAAMLDAIYYNED